jgi:hypothetical protein
MTAKEYLMQIRKLDIQIRNKKKELEVIQNQMTGVKSISFDKKEPATSKSTLSPQEKYYPLNMRKYRKVNIKMILDKLVHLKHEAMTLIDRIEDADCMDVLVSKVYVTIRSGKLIAVEMNFSYKWIHCIHQKALDLFDEMT